MARIVLTIDQTRSPSATTRFVANTKKIKGLQKLQDGSVLVTLVIEDRVAQLFVEEEFDFVADVMEAE